MPSCSMRRRCLRRRWCKGGGWRCSGELEKTSGVLTGSRGGNKGGLSGGSDIEVRSDIEYRGE